MLGVYILDLYVGMIEEAIAKVKVFAHNAVGHNKGALFERSGRFGRRPFKLG